MNRCRVGIDLSKNVFHVHAVDVEERVVLQRMMMGRLQLRHFLAMAPPCIAPGIGWQRRREAPQVCM